MHPPELAVLPEKKRAKLVVSERQQGQTPALSEASAFGSVPVSSCRQVACLGLMPASEFTAQVLGDAYSFGEL